MSDDTLYHQAFIQAPIGMAFVSFEGLWMEVNEAFSRITGYSQEELYNHSIQEITHIDDVQTEHRHLQQLLNKCQQTYQWEKRYIHKQGRVICTVQSVSVITNEREPLCFIFHIQDITKRLAYEEDVRQKHMKIQQILETAKTGTAFLDMEKGLLIETDQVFQNMLGYTEEELKHKPFSEFTHPYDTPMNWGLYQELLEGKREHYHMEKRYIRKDGQVIWGELTVCMIKQDVPSVMALIRDITDRKQLEEKLKETREKWKQLSTVDGLTGISNRRSFNQAIEREWARCAWNSSPLSLILLDIDSFKAYNDTYGHLCGDECLKQIAQAIKETVYRPMDGVFRYGGEEFAVLLSETSKSEARKIAEEIRVNIENLNIPHARSTIGKYVTVSAGVATMIPTNDKKIQDIITQSDQALYLSKNNGRNQVSD